MYMNLFPRVVLAFICGFFAVSIFAANAQLDENIAVVMHFNATTLNWDEEHIPGMDYVYQIYSAGKYAWATNQNKISFYNGSKWSETILIPAITNITHFAPAFPLTGKNPTAWLLAENANRDIYLAYFNGTNWATVATGLNSSNGTFEIRASAGYGWLQSDKDPFKPSFFRLTPDQPLKMRAIAGINYNHGENIIAADSFNDTTPYYFINRHSFFNGDQLLRVDANGSIKSIELKNIVDSDTGANMFVKGNDVVAIATKNKKMTVYNSRDNGITWKKSTTVPEDISYASKNLHNDYSDGVLYSDTENDFRPNNLVKRFALSFNDTNPAWQSFSIPGEFNMAFKVMTDSASIWLFNQDVDHNYKLFRYDVLTKQATDTGLSPELHDSFSARVVSIAKNQVIVCGINPNRQPIAYYFNGTTWSNQTLNSDRGMCQFNNIGGSIHPLTTLDKNSVWTY